jgi:hypothetical protein
MISIFTYKIGVKILFRLCGSSVPRNCWHFQSSTETTVRSGVMDPSRPVVWSGVGPTGSVPHDAAYLMHTCSTLKLYSTTLVL